MNTFRADIEAANDNNTRRKWRIFVSVLAVLLLVGAVAYIKIRNYLFDGLPDLPNKEVMWELNLQPNSTLFGREWADIRASGPAFGSPS